MSRNIFSLDIEVGKNEVWLDALLSGEEWNWTNWRKLDAAIAEARSKVRLGNNFCSLTFSLLLWICFSTSRWWRRQRSSLARVKTRRRYGVVYSKLSTDNRKLIFGALSGSYSHAFHSCQNKKSRLFAETVARLDVFCTAVFYFVDWSTSRDASLAEYNCYFVTFIDFRHFAAAER